MKRLLLILALALSMIVVLFPSSASSTPSGHRSAKLFREWTCTQQPDYRPPCVGNYGNWNHHTVSMYSGIGPAFCGSYTPSGAQQGSAYVYSNGVAKDISGWNYNRVQCWNLGGNAITLHFYEQG